MYNSVMRSKKREFGFTFVELMVVFVILGIMASVSGITYVRWLPNYRLKGAARDLYSNMQLARLQAVKNNIPFAVVFNPAGGSYQLVNSGPDRTIGTVDDVVQTTVNLIDYGSGIAYGSGDAATNWNGDGIPGDNVSYAGDRLLFNPRGISNAGSVYMDHRENDRCFAVTTLLSGHVRLRRWDNPSWN